MNRSQKTPALTFLITFLLSSLLLPAQRSYRYENFGNKSVLLNGNVTGSVSDLGAVFYNPARLALVENPKFSVEGRFYERSNVKIQDFLGDGINIENPRFNGLPGLVAGVFKLGEERFYYSFLTRNRINVSTTFDTGLLEANNNPFLTAGNVFNAEANIDLQLSEEWFGLSWAKKLSEKFSLGASLFFSTYNYSGNDRLSLALLSENQLIFGQGEAGFVQKSRGFYGKLSAAYKEKKLELGVTLDLPYLETSSEGQYNLKLFSTAGENSEDQFTVSQFSGLPARHKVPLGVNVGAGYAIGKNKLHLNIDWHAAIDAYQQIEIPTINSSTEPPTDIELIDELKSVLNFGVGTEIYLSPSLVSHLSFTTDYSPVESSDDLINTGNNLGEANILALDNYHFGGGFIIKTALVELSLGMVYTIASETFERVISLPIAAPIEDDGSFRVDVDRWRFLIGFNIPVAN